MGGASAEFPGAEAGKASAALTTLGSARSAGSVISATRVAISTAGSASGASTARSTSGAMVGRSPCRLITTSWRPSGSNASSASKMRSEPEP